MPIYAVESTKDGLRAIETYDGENSDIPFLQAVILTRAQGIVTTTDVYKFLTVEYALALADGAVTNAITKLEKRGYLRVYRDIELSINIYVDIGDFTVPTTLGGFINGSLARGLTMPISQITDDLKWHGISTRVSGATLRLR